MRLGVDTSTYFEEIDNGAKYYDGLTQVQPLSLLRKNGVDIMRIRLWLNPYGENGEKYLAGTCDMANFLRLAKLSKELGYKIMLDIHYSDFWADPGKQFLPKCWRGLNFEQLVQKVYEYTIETLSTVKQNGIDLEYVQVGNEITNGMLWPLGRLEEHGQGVARTGYERLCALLSAGCKACRELCPSTKIVLHLERSYDIAVYTEFFDNMLNYGVDFDTIGMSYYPYWHGTFEQLAQNIQNCKRYGKEIAIVEVGYAFTVEDYLKNDHGGAHLVVSTTDILPQSFVQQYPLTVEGQVKFVHKVLSVAQQNGVSAIIWWEPLWIPGENICWASKAGQEYIGEVGKSTRNEWANQCLFDYNGVKLPSFDAYCKN